MTREEAISDWTFRSNHIKKWLDEHGEEPSIRHYVELIDMAIEALSAEAVKGEWIPNHDGSWNCSECGLRVLVYAKGNFCPNCGARMEGEDGKA